MNFWPIIQLDDVCSSVDYGHTASATTEPVGPKFLRITDIQDGQVDWQTVPFCECKPADEASSRLKSGDIVFARTGATTGKSFLIQACPDRVVFASYLIRVRAGERVLPAYLAHFFRTPSYWAQISRSSRGAAQAGVNATSLKSLELPLPPLGEQRRIVAILDAVTALRFKRRAALDKLDQLAQSIFIEMFGDPLENPKRWPEIPLGAIAATKPNNGLFRTNDEYGVGLPVVWVQELFRGHQIETQFSRRVNATRREIENYGLKYGDILFCRSSLKLGGIGYNNVYLGKNDAALFECHLIRVSPDLKQVNPIFLNALFRQPSQRLRVIQNAKTVTMSTIDQAGLARASPKRCNGLSIVQ